MKSALTILCGCALLAHSAGAQDFVATLAGQALVSGTANAAGTNALFNDPAALVADAAGNLFVADSRNHMIRRIDTNGLVATFSGQAGVAGSANGTRAQAQFNSPSGIATDGSGNLFVSDTGNHTIRKITMAGVVTTIAGSAGQSGIADGPGNAAQFHAPLGLAVATNGTLYVADSGNHLIRVISPGGVVGTLAGLPETWGSSDGAGTNARFNGPVGVALNRFGEILVSDANNHTIRKITPGGMVTTWAGVAGADGCVNGARLAARFCQPAELAFDAQQNLYVADSFNHVLRRISADGRVSTVAGRLGSLGSTDGANGAGRFFNPYGVTVRPDGAVITTDAYNELIRLVLVPFQVRIHAAAGGARRLTWDAVVGRRYQVQSRHAKDSGAWTDLGPPLLAASTVLGANDDSASTPARLYRVLLLP